MASSSFNKFNSFVAALAGKVHNLGSDTLKVMLTNSAPVATNNQKTDLTEISPGNGYVAGGTQATLVSSGQVSGIYKLVLSNVVFTATGNSIGPFRYAVLYNDTASNKESIGWFDYGSAISLSLSESLTIGFDGINGVFQLA